MKKFLFSALMGLLLSAAMSASALSYTFTVPVAGATNVPPLINGSALVKQLIVTGTTNTTVLQVFDAPGTATSFVTPSYTNFTYYVTNYVTSYTNYYGVVNAFTNLAEVDTNTIVPQTTNSYNVRLYVGGLTNSSVYNGSWYFSSGVLFTNVSTAPAVVTVSIVQ